MRTLIFLVLIYLVYRLVKDHLLGGGSKGPEEMSGSEEVEKGVETALDPVCQSYVPVDSALRVRRGDEVHYFCSSECREKFIASLKE